MTVKLASVSAHISGWSPLQMTKHSNTLSPEDIKFMLRYTANAVRQNHHDLLPLLQWLEREYTMSRQSDPAAYARQLLESLNSE